MNETEYPFERGQFLCSDKGCNKLFYALRDKGEISEEDGDFFAKCPGCGADGIEPHYMRNLRGTVGTAKGANMSEESRRKTRLNGFKTGSSLLSKYHAGKIPMPPAKPDKYKECDDCQDIESCKDNVEVKKGTGVPVYCHRKGEIHLKYTAAFLSGDPEQLRMMAATNNAIMQQLFNNAATAVFEDGERLIETILHHDKDGDLLKDADGNDYTIERITAHPLIKQCLNYMQMMGYSLTDWTMTPKSKEAKEQVLGQLASAAASSGETPEDYMKKFTSSLSQLGVALEKGKALRKEDRALKDFEEGDTESEDVGSE